MKRRTFLAAVTPLIAAVTSASGQSPLGSPAGAETNRPPAGRARVGGAADTNSTEAAPAAAAAGGIETKKAKGPTEITSREAMLDNRIQLATFSGEVEVKDPEYNLTCDKLTVHLKKPKAKAEPKAAGPRPIGAEAEQPAAKPAPEGKGEGGGGGIEKAIAEGNVTIVQDKVDATGKKQRYFGKARRAVFDTDKRTCVLYGWPQISQSLDGNLGKRVVATQESTIITLDQAGSIKVEGPQKTTLSDLSAFEQNPGSR
jgi:lipopolysaccharide export system protein LptA